MSRTRDVACGLYVIFILVYIVLMSSCSAPAPVTSDYEDCTIYRDKWGVPHIHGKTDADMAYGLGWASCEDDFNTLQEQMIAGRGRYGEVKGMDGIVADFAIQFMGIRDYAREHMDEIDDATIRLLDGYVAGVNAYAQTHPEELIFDDVFPLYNLDLVAGSLLGLVEISGATKDLARLADGSIVEDLKDDERGSNAIAVSAKMTEEGQTFLAVNSHQPMQGWYSWYEVHLVSDEGMNMLGGTFPGGTTIFHGTNEYLGWAQTVNHADFSDVYKLTMHPDKEDYYQLDEEWKPLEKKVLRSWVKLAGPLKIPITRDIYESDFGITFKIGEEYFAWKYQALESVRSIEQWYKMNRATSWKEWRAALDMRAIPCTNIVYADREDNIYYVSNASQPIKDPEIDWSDVIDGSKSSHLWPEQYYPIDSLPHVLNPASGFVFNTNNTPYSSSGDGDDPVYTNAQKTMAFQASDQENNRSLRFQELMDTVTTLSYEEFKTIKYDQSYPSTLRKLPYDEGQLLQLESDEHPEISDAIKMLRNWNRSTAAKNEAAALFLLAKNELYEKYKIDQQINKEDYPIAIATAQRILMEGYGRLDVALGEFQRHRRGDVDIPLGGGADVLGAIYSRPDEDGKYTAFSGESYIQLVRFDKERGPIIESVHAYGSSARPESPHYTDQMQIFADRALKPMTLDMVKVKEEAVRQYHPMRVE